MPAIVASRQSKLWLPQWKSDKYSPDCTQCTVCCKLETDNGEEGNNTCAIPRNIEIDVNSKFTYCFVCFPIDLWRSIDIYVRWLSLCQHTYIGDNCIIRWLSLCQHTYTGDDCIIRWLSLCQHTYTGDNCIIRWLSLCQHTYTGDNCIIRWLSLCQHTYTGDNCIILWKQLSYMLATGVYYSYNSMNLCDSKLSCKQKKLWKQCEI